MKLKTFGRNDFVGVDKNAITRVVSGLQQRTVHIEI